VQQRAHELDLPALEIPPVDVDLDGAGTHVVVPDPLAEIGHEVRDAVLVPAAQGIELDQALEPPAIHQLTEHAHLLRADALHRTTRLDAAEDGVVDHPPGNGEDVVVQEVDRLPLALEGHRLEPLARTVLLLREHPADDRGDVAVVAAPLAHDVAVEILEECVALALLLRHVEEHVLHTLEVSETETGGLHRVLIADGLALRLGIGGSRRLESEPGGLVLLSRPLVQGRELLLRRGRAGDRSVGPLHREVVVRTDSRNQILDRHVVFRLRHVVEAGVVHERCDVLPAHPLDEAHRAQRVRRVHRARLEVVREADRVTDLVRDDVAHQLSHERIRER